MDIKAKGITNKSSKGDILEVFYPNIELGKIVRAFNNFCT